MVYVVDDDASVRKSLERLLQVLGFSVDCYASGRQFLDAYTPTEKECLVLDMRMPGMDGLATQKELQQRGYRLPIIFITAHEDPQAEQQALDNGASGFLRKPFDDRALLNAIRAATAMVWD